MLAPGMTHVHMTHVPYTDRVLTQPWVCSTTLEATTAHFHVLGLDDMMIRYMYIISRWATDSYTQNALVYTHKCRFIHSYTHNVDSYIHTHTQCRFIHTERLGERRCTHTDGLLSSLCQLQWQENTNFDQLSSLQLILLWISICNTSIPYALSVCFFNPNLSICLRSFMSLHQMWWYCDEKRW